DRAGRARPRQHVPHVGRRQSIAGKQELRRWAQPRVGGPYPSSTAFRAYDAAKRHARLGTVARTSARRVAHSASFRARSASATQTSRRWSKWRRDLVKRTAATVLRERLG